MQTIWFIRHAESESNAGQSTSDPAMIGLTETGHEQAKQIAQAFDKPPSLIVTSCYIRTKLTALPTRERFSGVNIEEWQVHEFTYLSSRKHRNTTFQQRRPQVRAYWDRCDPHYVDDREDPDTESFAKFMQRVHSVLELLREREEDFIAVFSHEQFIWAVFWLLLFRPTEMSSRTMKQFKYLLTTYPIPNGAILQVQFEDKEETWVRGIITSHLAEAIKPRLSIYALLCETATEDELNGTEIDSVETPLIHLEK